MSRLSENAIRIYHRGTPAGQDIYPVVLNERLSRVQTAAWDRRVVTGPVSADAEQMISSWTQDDYSGGFGIKDGNESTDVARIAFGIMDGRRPKSMCLPPLTSVIAKPSWATAAPAYPLGDVGSNFYVAFNNGIAGFNSSTGLWRTSQNVWPGSALMTPTGKAVMFCGNLFVPLGANGFVALTETNATNGTLTVTQLSTIPAVEFGLHDNKLWAIDTANNLWMLTTIAAAAGATTLANWLKVKDGVANDVRLDTSLTPTKLINYYNAAQTEVLWCITRGQGAFMFDPDGATWIKSTVKEGAHPDWGIAAEVFRDGEDLFISGGGLDVTRFTTGNVEVPLSGINKDQGVPPAYEGSIVDMQSERSSMYALVSAGVDVAPSGGGTLWTLMGTYGSFGTGTQNYSSPQQVAKDSSGNTYTADFGNSRVVKRDSAGIYQGSFAPDNPPVGVAILPNGDIAVLVADGDIARIRFYNSSFAFIGGESVSNISAGSGNLGAGHLAVNASYLFAVDRAGYIYRWTSTGTTKTILIGTGTGDSQIAALGGGGIAADATHFYVADTPNGWLKKFTNAGTFVTKWAISSTVTGVAVDGSGNVWVADRGSNTIKRYSNTGVLQATINQSTPVGLAVTTGDVLWATSGQHNLTKWDETVVAPVTPAPVKSWLAAWTGTAWCGLWESAAAAPAPTWLKVQMSASYSLWWGDINGNCYRQLLPPPFFNPAARMEYPLYPFASTGWMETFRYDAQMSGWDKIASHAFAQMDYATASEYVDVLYRTDHDQYETGLIDPPYRAWKRVDHIGRTLMWFDDVETDPNSGLPWHEGESFQWIQFKFVAVRGSNAFKTPVWMWHSLHHLAIPQDNSSITLKIPLSFDRNVFKRSPNEMAQTLRNLQRTRAMLHLQTGTPRPEAPDQQVFFRGRLIKVNSEFKAGANNNIDEVLVCNFIEVEPAVNEHTTVAPCPPSRFASLA